jgi:hypothetical protein
LYTRRIPISPSLPFSLYNQEIVKTICLFSLHYNTYSLLAYLKIGVHLLQTKPGEADPLPSQSQQASSQSDLADSQVEFVEIMSSRLAGPSEENEGRVVYLVRYVGKCLA